MSSQAPGPPPSTFPATMGPGARPTQSGLDSSPGALLKDIAKIRSSYQMNAEANLINLSYELNGATRRYSVPFENMPMGGFSQWLCFGGAMRSHLTGYMIIDAIRGAENMTGRRLTQAEAEGFAKYGSKRMQYSFTGQLLALAGGFALALRGRQNMKFPFIKPKDAERYTSFPNRYLPLLKGSWARLMWQITRVNVYLALGLLAAGPVAGSMGDTSMMVGLYRDPRTQNVLKDMKEKGGFDRVKSNRSRSGQNTQPQHPQPQSQPDDGSPQDGDFSSSYGSSDAYSGDTIFSDLSRDAGAMTDSMAAKRQSQQSQQIPSTRQPQQTSFRRPPQPQQNQSSSDFFFDDASPTAGNAPGMATQSPSQSGESAWSRIRKGSSNPNDAEYQQTRSQVTQALPKVRAVHQRVNNATREQRDSFETSGDSFSFAKGDEDRQLAKEQAQKDFDAMLEKERRESGIGDYQRGMDAAQVGREDGGVGVGGSAWGRRRGS